MPSLAKSWDKGHVVEAHPGAEVAEPGWEGLAAAEKHSSSRRNPATGPGRACTFREPLRPSCGAHREDLDFGTQQQELLRPRKLGWPWPEEAVAAGRGLECEPPGKNCFVTAVLAGFNSPRPAVFGQSRFQLRPLLGDLSLHHVKPRTDQDIKRACQAHPGTN